MTSTESRASWSDRLSPRNWSLAWKLVAVGLVPALLAVVLGVLRVADQAHTASDLGAANRLLEIRLVVADTAAALRVERDRATVFLAERRLGDRGPLTDAVGATDAAVERIRTGLGDAQLDPATRVAHERSDGGLAQLSVLRSGVTGSAPLLPAQVLQRYTTIIDRVDGFDRALLRQVRTPEVAGLTDAMSAVTAASEALALQHTVLGVALRTGAVTPADAATVGVTDGAYVTAFSDYQLALPTSMQPVNFVTSESNAQRDAAKSAIVLAPTPGPIPITPAAWDDAVGKANADVDRAGGEVRTALTSAGEAAEARSSNLAGVNSVLLMLGLLLAATIVVLVARSLTRSLRVLRTSALDVAQRRLPQAVEGMRAGNAPDVTVEPVPLPNRDEVGQVARAFDAVHGQALRLAADQAALQSNVSSMFVNLSRRSQGLVERQLQLIEQLESNEQDPDQLSNLFQLDHLATRMRRNSENLLVLAGTDFAKRNVAPVPLVDVLRAAVSEIEHYQRITVQAPPQATIIGRATSDIVHLLAELLDNATNFSPPESQVVMSSMRTPDGSILVEIADRGVGMLDQELSDANRRLTTPSTVDVSASRRMGLFVVGRLGARHGITVHLGGAPMGGPGGGLTASVTLPAHLVVSAGDDSRPSRVEPAAAALGSPNGVPPQRGDQAGRLPSRTAPAPAGAANGQLVPQPTGLLNGLPTRTPGSALRRNPIPGLAPFEPREAPETGTPAAAEWRGGAAEGAPRSDDAIGDRPPAPRPPSGWLVGGRPEPEQAGDIAPADSDALPTGAMSAVAGVRDGDLGTHHDAATNGATPYTDAHGGDRRSLWDDTDASDDDRSDADRSDTVGSDTDGSDTDGPETHGSDDAGLETTGLETGLETEGLATGTAGIGSPETGSRETGSLDAAESDDTPAGVHEAARSDEPRVEVAPTGADLPTVEPAVAAERAGAVPDEAAEEAEDGASRERADDVERDTGSDASGEVAPAARRASPRPRPSPRPMPAAGPGPNGTFRDLTVPSAPYEAADPGAVPAGIGQNGNGQNGHHGDDRFGDDRYGDPDGGISPPTTPLPVIGPDASPMSRPFALPGMSDVDDGADALFSASVPSITEPDGLPRSRRPLAELRRGGPADVTETTPIFEEIASAWFASHRPVPVDWELGQRPGGDPVADVAPPPPPRPGPVVTDPRGTPAVPSGRVAPSVEPSAFASAADEGWRAANGAAADRPDELTAAGLPKRRPRARLVPGSAGSAVLAAPTSPTRSAESIRGRLASYQQGVRQGREIRLRRDPGGAGPEPSSTGENTAVPTGGEHDEETR